MMSVIVNVIAGIGMGVTKLVEKGKFGDNQILWLATGKHVSDECDCECICWNWYGCDQVSWL